MVRRKRQQVDLHDAKHHGPPMGAVEAQKVWVVREGDALEFADPWSENWDCV